MTTFRAVLTTALALLAAPGLMLRAQTPPSTPPIRVLVTYGGHDFQAPEFWAMWDALPGVTYTKAPLPESAGLFRPGLEKNYDVVVLYDMFTGLTPDQKRDFESLLSTTRIGLVALHHSSNAHTDWDTYRRILGGRYLDRPQSIDGREYPASTYHHDQEIDVTIADPNHPITRGLKPFRIHDETYGGVYIAPDAHSLLVTDHPTWKGPLVWTHAYGPHGRVVVNLLGHDAQAWSNPAYPELLGRCVRWAAARD
jgi:type 1 glutamine amidotransferase